MTAQQIVDLRDDIADAKEAFGDPTLQRYWERTSGAADEFTHLNAVKALCYENLLANASLLHDYTAGATGHKLSQVRAHLKDQYARYAPALEAAMGQKREFGFVGLRSFPNADRTEPGDV
jgi:hypothetical protein